MHADVGSFVSFLGALLLAYEPAKRLSRFPVDIQNGSGRREQDLRSARRAARRGLAAGRAAADRERGARRARGRALRLSRRRRGAQRPRAGRRAQSDDGAGRPVGRRQVDHSRRHPAFLCARAAARRRSTARTSPPSISRRCAPRSLSSRRTCSCFAARFATTSRSGERAPRKRRSSKRRASAHAHDFIMSFAEGYDTKRRRTRHATFGRPASAHRHRSRDPQERADPAARRADGGARFGVRARSAEGA